MFTGQILIGNWDMGCLEITGMPKNFSLSARKLVVMEEKEYTELVAERDKWQSAYEEDDIRTNSQCEKFTRLEAENKAKDERIKELQEYIRKNSGHHPSCGKIYGRYACTCGFEQALKEAGGDGK